MRRLAAKGRVGSLATEWTAYSRDGSIYAGQTPEDALANLWLGTHRQFDREIML